MSQGGYIHLQVAGGASREGSIQEGQMKPDEQRVEAFQTTWQFFIGWMCYFFLQHLHFCLSRMKLFFLTRPVKLQRHPFGQNDVGFLAPGVDLLFAGKKELFTFWGDQL